MGSAVVSENGHMPKRSASSPSTTAAAANTAGRRRPVVVENPIEVANKKSDPDFVSQYLCPSTGWDEWKHPSTGVRYSLRLKQAGRLTEDEVEQCFRLVDATSGPDYRSSSMGWHPAAKRKEMRSPELRYLLVKQKTERREKKEAEDDDDEGAVVGFTSLMPTFENGEPVVYCYEIHLGSELQRTGLGRQLMQRVIDVAERIPSVRKTMLTCFLSNANGLGFYDKMGFATDPFSPGERKLRGGKVVKPDYVILSRATTKGPRRERSSSVKKSPSGDTS